MSKLYKKNMDAQAHKKTTPPKEAGVDEVTNAVAEGESTAKT